MKNVYLKQIGYFPKRNVGDILYFPVETFEKLRNEKYKSKSHIAFAFTYLVNITWVYRYLKYENILSSTENTPAELLKIVSGISKTTRTMDYITKKDGLLDHSKLTENIGVSDIPFWIDYSHEDVIITTIGEALADDVKINSSYGGRRNFVIKKPTFFLTQKENKRNSFHIDYFILYYLLAEENLTNVDFYVYCYFKMKNQYFGEQYNESYESLTNSLGLERKMIINSTRNLSNSGLLEICSGGFINGKNVSNGYTILEKKRRVNKKCLEKKE